jgi:CRISPR-associated protein Cmr3
MEYWIIEPHDSVIIRDGRPFSTVAGVAKAQSLPFVTPSVMAGALRGRVATNSDGAFYAGSADVNTLQTVSMAGYMIVRRGSITPENTFKWDPFLPRPADAILLENALQWYRVTPRVQRDCQTDLADSGLSPLHLPDNAPVAKIDESASFWNVSIIQQWLMGSVLSRDDTRINAIDDLPRDERYHVAIDSKKGIYESGKLFATSAIGFRYNTVSTQRTTMHQLAILVSVNEQQSMQLADERDIQNVGTRLRTPPAIDTLGGEQRMVRWNHVDAKSVNYSEYLSAPPPDVITSVQRTKNCRILLTTPAYIEDIAKPQQLSGQVGQLTVTVNAIALSRAEWHSGWDMMKKKPKYARRLVPAGTVFFVSFSFAGNDDADKEIAQWISSKWMQPLSDNVSSGSLNSDQMCRDGAGIALIGCGWSE